MNVYDDGTMLKAHYIKAHDVQKTSQKKNKEKEFVSLKMLRSREKLFFFLLLCHAIRT